MIRIVDHIYTLIARFWTKLYLILLFYSYMSEMAAEQNQEDIQTKLIIPEEKYNQLLVMSEKLSNKVDVFKAK